MVATFDYRAASTVREVVDLLAEYGDDAKVLAGGQSLIALINLGLAQPSMLVDINKLHELDHIELRDGSLAIGALTRHATAERSDVIRQACPLLAEAIPLIGDRQVRNRGTIGGSIAHADPSAEIPTVAVCLDAAMRIEGHAGAREVGAAEFFVSYLTTAIRPGELLTQVRFPVCPPGMGASFQELVRRKGDFAIVAAACTVTLGNDRTCTDVRLALAGVAPTPVGASEAGAPLRGRVPTPELIREAARAACQGLQPDSDVMASGSYRLAMAEVYARRALTEAVRRAETAHERR